MRLKFCMLVILVMCVSLDATMYYVSTAGDDGNDGLTPETAWATLMHAVPQVEGGDIVEVAPGEYTGFLHSPGNGGVSGSMESPIIYRGAGDGVKIVTGLPNSIPAGTPGGGGIYGICVLESDYIVIDGFEVNGMSRAGIGVEESHNVTVRNCKLVGNKRWGVFTSFANYCTIEHNYCAGSTDEHGIYYSNSSKGAVIRYNISHSNRANGIHMNGDRFFSPKFRDDIEVTGVIEGAEIYGNIIYNNGRGGGAGINMDGVQSANVYNNLLYDLHGGGITCYGIDGELPSQNATIYNNTIIIASDGRSNIQFADHTESGVGAINGKVFNNILINKGSRGVIEVHTAARTGFSSGHNIVTNKFELAGASRSLMQWQAAGFGVNSQVVGDVEDLFIDEGEDNYDLQPESSPAIDAGDDIVADLVNTDIRGVSRPSGSGYDIGAYELNTETWAGYTVENGIVRTQQFLGDLYIGYEPWIYGYQLSGWIFFQEENITDTGVWGYVIR